MSGPFGSAQLMYNPGFYPELIDQSLRFDGTAYLSRTPSVAGNRRTWTWSGWVKLSKTSFNNFLECVGPTTPGTRTTFMVNDLDKLDFFTDNTGSSRLTTTQVFRDFSAWYHIVLAVDTTQATPSNRVKIYLNGSQITAFATANYPSQNLDTQINNTQLHTIGKVYDPFYSNMYLADTYFVDGTALDPTSFGEFKNGVWIPKAYTGSYGTNGFHLTYQDDTVSEGFNTVTYTGNGGTQSITGVGFQPDLVWVKGRNETYYHRLTSIGLTQPNYLATNATDAESSGNNTISSLDSNGFTVDATGTGGTNESAINYVAWNWDAGDSTVSNTDGSITSSVRANPAYGFSIVSYTGNGTNGATIGHGLGATPAMIITKKRNLALTWYVWHQQLSGANYGVALNTTDAEGTFSYGTWGTKNSTIITATQGTNGLTNVNASSDTYVAYCFSEIAGYSKFGSYTGTGASGNVVTTGFKPAFVMIKNTSSTGEWMMFDATRSAAGKITNELYANTSDAEATVLRGTFDSNGFTIDSTSASLNTSSAAYIYMAFADTRDLAFWRDQSGNGNDWQPTNLNYQDTVFDSPTNNYCTLNPLDKDGHTNSEGNLKVSGNVIYGHEKSTFAVTSGKWYFEAALTVQQNDTAIGLANQSASTLNHYLGQTTDSVGYLSDGRFFYNGSSTSYSSWTTSDVAQIAFDADTGEIWIGKNNTYQNSGDPANGTGEVVTVSWNEFIPAARTVGSGALVFNFGQSGFTYTPPDGFLALSTANLPEPSISPLYGASPQDHFNTVTYTGNGVQDRTVSGVGFEPDFTWIKDRGAANTHVLFDSVRGGTKQLFSNLTNSEQTNTDLTNGFASDGFIVGDNITGTGATNLNSNTYVAWNWKASNATAVSNTAGTITSQVSANPTAGFSIVSYTGTGATATVGHGLGAAPEMVIYKIRSVVDGWGVYHAALGNTQALLLESTVAAITSSTYWNSTSPTSAVLSLGTWSRTP
jgi:hypothetical protein